MGFGLGNIIKTVADAFTGDPISSAVNVVGDISGALGSQDASHAAQSATYENTSLQKEFAQNGIQWKVEDARKAGINPLFALGTSEPTYSPSTSVGVGDLTGQNFSRAVDATRSTTSRMQARMDALQLEHAGLENDLLRSQIARLNPPHVGPALPTLKDNGSGVDADAVNTVSWARNPDGSLSPVPSMDFSQRVQNAAGLIPSIQWAWRNNLHPLLNQGMQLMFGPRPFSTDPTTSLNPSRQDSRHAYGQVGTDYYSY